MQWFQYPCYLVHSTGLFPFVGPSCWAQFTIPILLANYMQVKPNPSNLRERTPSFLPYEIIDEDGQQTASTRPDETRPLHFSQDGIKVSSRMFKWDGQWMMHCFVKSLRCMSVCISIVLLLGSIYGCTMPLPQHAERPIVIVLENSWIVSYSGDGSRSKLFSGGLALSKIFTRSLIDALISSSTLGILISLLSFSYVALALVILLWRWISTSGFTTQGCSGIFPKH